MSEQEERHVHPPRYRVQTANLWYFFSDHLGSTRLQTDATGGVVQDIDYYPGVYPERSRRGGERIVTELLGNGYKFTGQERDSESGLDYFIARHYSSNLARFVNTDPKPNLRSAVVNAQRWNYYSYSLNNPMNYYDPDGLADRNAWEVFKKDVKRIPVFRPEPSLGFKVGGRLGPVSARGEVRAKGELDATDLTAKGKVVVGLTLGTDATRLGPQGEITFFKTTTSGDVGLTFEPEAALVANKDSAKAQAGSEVLAVVELGDEGLAVDVGVNLTAVGDAFISGGSALTESFNAILADIFTPILEPETREERPPEEAVIPIVPK